MSYLVELWDYLNRYAIGILIANLDMHGMEYSASHSCSFLDIAQYETILILQYISNKDSVSDQVSLIISFHSITCF